MRRRRCLGLFALTMLGSGASAAKLPTPRTTVIAPTAALEGELADDADGPYSTLTRRPDDNAAGGAVLRFTLGRVPRVFYGSQYRIPAAVALEKGQICLVRFRARMIESRDETGMAVADVYFQQSATPWGKPLHQRFHVGAKWRQFDLPLRQENAAPVGGMELVFGVAGAVQTWELADVEVFAFEPGVKRRDLPHNRLGYLGRDPAASWRSAAEARIEKYRKGPLKVVVTDATGQPVSGAKVEANMVRHAFRFGSTISVRALMDEGPNREPYRERVQELFSHVSIENALKWPPWDQSWGDAFSREKTLAALHWLKGHGLRIHGHVLVWPSFRHVPKRIAELKEQPAALRQAVLDHIDDELRATAGLVEEFDVINEPFNNHDLMDVLGQEVMVDWFRRAREAAGLDLRLYINDYGIVAGYRGPNGLHLTHYESTIRYLLDQGAPLQGIGIQSHFGGDCTPPETALAILDRFAAFGLPLQITEFDVNTDDEELQADYLRDCMTLVFSHPATNGFVMWGFWEGAHWRPQAAMFRKDWEPKPSAAVYRDLVLKRWWTRAAGTADGQGSFETRGFLGDYEITAAAAGRRQSVRTSLPREGRTVTVTLPAE